MNIAQLLLSGGSIQLIGLQLQLSGFNRRAIASSIKWPCPVSDDTEHDEHESRGGSGGGHTRRRSRGGGGGGGGIGGQQYL